MQDLKFYYSIEEVFKSVSSLESKIQSVLLVDPTSSTALKLIKKLMLLCTSVSITLIQQDKLEETVSLLRSSDSADSELLHFRISGTSWQGRLLTPTILAFLYFKQHRYTDSLKFLYKTLTLAQEIKESGKGIHTHLKNLIHLLGFMILWKLGRYTEAEKYLLTIQDLGMDSIRGRNMFGIISMARAGVVMKKGKEFLTAIKICEDALEILEPDEVTYDLIKTLISEIYSEIKFRSTEDFLVTSSFITVVFVSNFIPLIAPGTPMLKQEKMVPMHDSKKALRPVYSASRTRSEVATTGKLWIEDFKEAEIAPLTTRRSQLNTSRDRIQPSSVPRSSLQITTSRAYVGPNLRVSYFSPRISQGKRPRSSKISLKNKSNNVHK